MGDKVKFIYISKSDAAFIKDEYCINPRVVMECDSEEWEYLKSVRGMEKVYEMRPETTPVRLKKKKGEKDEG